MSGLKVLGLCWRCANGGENIILEHGGGDWWKEWVKWVFADSTTVFKYLEGKFPMSMFLVTM
jgi:hypothetical protein